MCVLQQGAVQDIFTALADGPFDAVIVLGSGGSGKTIVGRKIFDLAKQRYGEEGAARCANSGRVAVNVGCTTFARRLKYGSYTPHAEHAYSNITAAEEVAQIQMLIAEEVTAVPNRLLQQHLGARTAARRSVNLAHERLQQQPPYTIEGPLGGLKLIASGDHLQQIVVTGSVGRVQATGVPVPFVPPQGTGRRIWELSELADAKVLVLVVHGNHRLLGRMHELHRTGCDLCILLPFRLFLCMSLLSHSCALMGVRTRAKLLFPACAAATLVQPPCLSGSRSCVALQWMDTCDSVVWPLTSVLAHLTCMTL